MEGGQQGLGRVEALEDFRDAGGQIVVQQDGAGLEIRLAATALDVDAVPLPGDGFQGQMAA